MLKIAEFDYEAMTVDGSKEAFQKYELFVDTVLNASEEILQVLPTKEWVAAVRIQLRQHRDYLLSRHFQTSGYLEQYTPKFRGISRTVHAEIPRLHARRPERDTKVPCLS
ncbi:MAG: hypothetical protein ACREDO_05925 [Methyloceanibacter sp.]